MQASKIIVGSTYALRISDNDKRPPTSILVRYIVSAVVTRRKGRTGSPHDFDSTVEGWVIKADLPPGYVLEPSRGGDSSGERLFRIVQPAHIEGPFEETVELRAREDAERAARAAESEKSKQHAMAVRLALYRLVGANDVPEDAGKYGQMFRARASSTDVDISTAGTEALYRALCEEKADA